jgi:hypothetical protein
MEEQETAQVTEDKVEDKPGMIQLLVSISLIQIQEYL